MSFEEFAASIQGESPPPMPQALQALWYDEAGDWDKAHDAAQADRGPAGAWVHAYLHRKEGDLGNAQYWYAKARQPVSKLPLEEEWEAIARDLLKA